ncbi:hypothetical protein ACP3V3_19805 [Vibrio sp. PNB22_3_1]
MVCVEIELDGALVKKDSPYYKTPEGGVDIEGIRNYFIRLGYSAGKELVILKAELLPWDEGINAYESRASYRDNPYKEGSWQREQWLSGWMAQDDMDIYTTYDYSTHTFKSRRV